MLLLLLVTNMVWGQQEKKPSLGKRIREALRSTSVGNKSDGQIKVMKMNLGNEWKAIEETDSFSIPFRIVDGNMLIEADGDGKTLTLVFDTGAKETTLNASYHGHETSLRGSVVTESIDGLNVKHNVPLSIAVFNRWRMGGNTYSLRCGVSDFSFNEKLHNLDGLFGCDFIVDLGYETHIDFGANSLTFYKIGADGQSSCPLKPRQLLTFDEYNGYLPLLSFTIADTNLRLLFDTGCTGTALMPQTYDRVVVQNESQMQGVVVGVDSMIKTEASVVDSIALGQVVKHRCGVVKVNLPFNGIDGMIGMDFFQGMHVSINHVTRQFCIY